MLSDGEHCIDRNEIIEKTWNTILINWVNKCAMPNMVVSELNEECFTQVVKRYNRKMYAETIGEGGFSDTGVGIFLRKHYPVLASRDIKDVDGQRKKLYIAMTALLYDFCVHDRTGTITGDISNELERIERKMIIRVCKKLKTMDITAVNIESAIKDAYDVTYGQIDIGRPIPDLKKFLPPMDKEITGIEPTKEQLKKEKIAVTKSKDSIDLKTIDEDKERNIEGVLDAKSYLEQSDIDPKLLYEPSVQLDIASDLQMDSVERLCHKRIITSRPRSDEDLLEMDVQDSITRCHPSSTYIKSSMVEPSCGDPGYSMEACDTPLTDEEISSKNSFASELVRGCDWKLYCALAGMILLAVLIVLLCSISLWDWNERAVSEEMLNEPVKPKRLDVVNTGSAGVEWKWQCHDQFCVKAHIDKNLTLYRSLSRCSLLCMGPQLWPYPIGYIHFSETIVALTTTNLEYKFQSVPSEIVHNYLADAFKLFLKGLARLEKIDKRKLNKSQSIDLPVKRISVHIEVENDPDPRLRLNTEEAYMLSFETIGSKVVIKVVSGSFCGARHGLETASQLILLDQATGYLLTYSEITIKDAPSYRYRGLMLDTGRNFIPVTDIMRTVDAMAACKFNTLHWRISSDTSFPLYLSKLPLLFEYGAYDRTLMYTKEDVKRIVKVAGLRGIRVLIEVTAPGPVGRPWSWAQEATCPMKTDNYTCENVLCTRMLMEKSIFDALEIIYAEILQMTGVDDVFHLSDGMFSMTNCYQLISDRDGFLEKALERLRIANKGFLPTLPIIWYTSHLMKDSEAKTWERRGVQLNNWDPNPGERYLGKFRVIHSTKWDLSCEMSKHRCFKFTTWQEMYSWKSWRGVEVFTIEGGEAILWTDFVSSGNLDNTLWPRAAAVAERLWSDMNANSTANRYVYVRLDTHRWRMLLRGIKVQPIWPAWCSFNPSECLAKIRT